MHPTTVKPTRKPSQTHQAAKKPVSIRRVESLKESHYPSLSGGVQRQLLRLRGLAAGRGAQPPSAPESRERRTLGLRLLPPGPGQVRPSSDRAPPYGGAGLNRRPRGAGHRRGAGRLTRRSHRSTVRLLTPPYSPFEVWGRAGSPVLPAAATYTRGLLDKCVLQQGSRWG